MIISPSLTPFTPSATLISPTTSFFDAHDSPPTSMTFATYQPPGCTDISSCRTLPNIVLSCLTTISACTWVALHLNVPGPRTHQSFWRSLLRRVGWMLVALVAPEIITGIAIKELLKAKMYVRKWNTQFLPLCSPDKIAISGYSAEDYARGLNDKKFDSRWTLRHGFLAVMGGLRFYTEEGIREKFGPHSKHLEDPRMQSIIQQIGLISGDDIKDKSKGDWISKLFVISQTTWFIFQCIARWAVHLPVVELEVVTLAYAVQNIFIYSLWWHKPQSLSVPFYLYPRKEEQIQEKPGANDHKEEPVSERSPSPNPTDETSTPSAGSVQLETRGKDRRVSGRNPKITDPNELPEIIGEALKVTGPHSRMQSFHVRQLGGDIFWFSLLIAGTIFGALHLLPLWLSVFPSHVEKQLWQMSAFYVTVIPIGLPIAATLILWVGTCCCLPFDVEDASLGSMVVFVCASLTFYAVARVILLVLPFTTLRALPVEAFQIVKWTRFIPHF